jgi:ATP-dependent Clp endopeptidase proteolytic subunit ClpP
MPITPNEEESKVDFMSRCMSDAYTTEVYEDEGEREEYCTLSFNEANPTEETAEEEADVEVEAAVTTPEEDEEKEDFMTRCMEDGNEEDVCSIAWDESQEEEEEEETEEIEEASSTDIFVYDVIGAGGVTAKQIVNEIAKVEANAPINLRINSAGGDVFEGIAIYNSLKKHQGTVTVEIEGLAASMASVIMLAGDNISASDNSLIMIHNPNVGIQGESKDLTKKAELLDKIKDQMVGIYSAKTGIDTEQIEQMMDSETWLTAVEAQELGFVNNVGEAIKISAVNDITVFNNVPKWAKNTYSNKPNNSLFNEIGDMLMSLKDKITGVEKSTIKGVRILDNDAVKNTIVDLTEQIMLAADINDELEDTLGIVASLEDEVVMLKAKLSTKDKEINKNSAKGSKVSNAKDPSILKKGKTNDGGWGEMANLYK